MTVRASFLHLDTDLCFFVSAFWVVGFGFSSAWEFGLIDAGEKDRQMGQGQEKTTFADGGPRREGN